VDSIKGRGTVFTVAFPKVKEKGVFAGEKKPVSKSEGEKILFVDDETALTDIGKRIFERIGYKVVTANSGAEALALFSEDPMQFDVVITDTTMPHMTGIELSKELMSIRPDIPIVVCTGYSELISPEKAKQLGIKKVIMKPFIKSDIVETIQKVLRKDGIS
jgi:CheY-like chemotaxis protein